MEQKPILEFIWNLISRNTKEISKVDYFPQKPVYPQFSQNEAFPRATPYSQGISPKSIIDLLDQLSESSHTHMHQLMIIKNGKIITECGFAPYTRNLWHASYSLCKSITGIAIGMLIDEGKLHVDDRLVDIFKRQKNFMTIFRQRDITVKHLLTMTSGVSFNEAGAVTGNDWVKGFLESSVKFTPGSQFEYNSMNSYMLSAIVSEITGETMMEYLRKRLWAPLGITNVFWETCPKGITKGGWGLFICPEDAGKIGQLFLQKGKWDNTQIISKEWIEEATSPKTQVPSEMGFGGYGYQIWMGKRSGSYVFNGMLGQNVLIYPDIQMIIVTNAGNSVLFQKCEMLDIIHNIFAKDEITKNHSMMYYKYTYHKLQKKIEKLEEREQKPKIYKDGWSCWKKWNNKKKNTEALIRKLYGRSYKLNDTSVSLFPLMLQVVHNNFEEGISMIHFMKTEDKFCIQLKDGEFIHTIYAGILCWKETELNLKGEIYRVAAMVQATKDEDDRTVLKLNIAFLEEASNRIIKFFWNDSDMKQLEIQWMESPGAELILEGLESVAGSITEHPILSGIHGKNLASIFTKIIKQTIEPVTTGMPVEETE